MTRLAVVLAVAFGLAGCGSSASSPSSVGAGSGSGSGLGSGSGSGSGASGRVYEGSGFQFSYPSGWGRLVELGGASGASSASVTQPGTEASITVHTYPSPHESLQQALADDLLTLQTSSAGAVGAQPHVKVSVPSVPGAQQARLLTESSGSERYMDLVVIDGRGRLISLEADAPAKAADFDPSTVISSFKLG